MSGMWRVSLTGLRAHKRRMAGTFLAVFLGVAFLAGTLVLGATLSTSIDNFYGRANAGTDVVVRSAISVSDSSDARRGPIPAAVADRVRTIDGVAVAAPTIQGFGQLVGHDGTAVAVDGPRTAGNWIEDADLNPYRVVNGRSPRADDEVVVNRGAAKLGELHVGDRTTLLTPAPVPVTVVGVVTFGDADAFGGTSYVGLTLYAAQRYLAPGPGQISGVAVKGHPGVGQDDLVRRIRPVLPDGVEAITGAQLTRENVDSVSTGFVSMFRTFLTLFAVVALLVAAFSINNTFAILVAQRTRESALLRAIGASRRQILVSVVAEATAVGVLATAAGLAGGIGLAALLKGAFAGLGFDLPATGLVFTASTAAICVPVGICVTVLAAVVPAVRASRTPPLEALREVAVEGTRTPKARTVAGGTITLAGAALALAGLGGGDTALALAGIGAVLTTAGVVILGPAILGPVSAIVGAPATLRGVAGVLARRNAVRNPRRTAGAAAALMIGVAVVTLFTVFAASLQASTVDSVGRVFTGDLAISSGDNGNGGISPRLTTDLARLTQLSAVAGVGAGSALIAGESAQLTVADPAVLTRVVQVDPVAGSVRELPDGQVAVTEKVARDRGWHIGADIPVRYADGSVETLALGAIYRTNPLVGDYLIPERTWRAHTPAYLDTTIYVAFGSGVDSERERAAVTAAVAPYGAPAVQDREQLVDARAQNLRSVLNLVYVMLVLAILIALMGIANTLALAVHERTRELGLLRAVGATRRQVRTMVRWESAITAVFGTLCGIGLGLFLGWTLVHASSTEGTAAFTMPPIPLAAILVGGALAGLLAGLAPARRAARLPLLQAVANE